MYFSSLVLNGFRNFSQASFDFSKRINFFYGSNGAGKTSILEALYYLVLGRSFRTHLIRRLVRHREQKFTLYGILQDHEHSVTVGVTRSLQQGRQFKVGGKAVPSHLELIRLLPIQLLNQGSALQLMASTQSRRQFIDWGLFHVEHRFLSLWKQVGSLLKQRNSAIQERARIDYITIWDEQLAKAGVELHDLREKYIKALVPLFAQILTKISGDLSVEITYKAGWDTDLTLRAALAANLKQDLQVGYTTIGPQRADIVIRVLDMPAQDILSRGQQKITIYAMQIAQGILLHRLCNRPLVYLIDDLLAELDEEKSSQIVELLYGLEEVQLFFTGLELHSLAKIVHNDSLDKRVYWLTKDKVKKILPA